MGQMASGAWYKSGKFTVPDSVNSDYTINFGKSLSGYLFLIEMTDDSKLSLQNSGLTANRIYSWVGIYPLRSIANGDNAYNLLVSRYIPSTAAISGSYANVFTCDADSISMPIRSISNTVNGIYPGYEYNYYIVEIK